jgi:2-polyprenyl-3-methyl-5-hydroxy-6-metoxy-1,4-benzoquinol methylase
VSTALKYTRFNDDPGSAHMLVVDLVPEGARVLEFGCATGYMSAVLKNDKGSKVTGIEISPEAGELAREHCDRVIVGDAEELDYDELLGKERFDAILFVDVLEHLKEPGEVLNRIRPFLSRRGAVLASIPNIAHGSVRLALLGGEFRYRKLGLLDDTHLRFFTREGIRDLFEGEGFVISHWLHHRVDIDRTEVQVPALPMSESLRDWLSKDPDTSVYQFVVRALPATAANQVAALRAELASVEDELRVTVEQQGAFIEALRTRIKTLGDQERETHDLLLEANRRLLIREQELSRLEAEKRDEIEGLEEQVGELQGKLDAIYATKMWRAAGKLWQVRNTLSGAGRRTRT